LDVCSEVLKNIWLKTYSAGAYTTRRVSTKLGASDDRTIIKGTLCVRGDCEISIIKDRTNARDWKMKVEVSLQINT